MFIMYYFHTSKNVPLNIHVFASVLILLTIGREALGKAGFILFLRLSNKIPSFRKHMPTAQNPGSNPHYQFAQMNTAIVCYVTRMSPIIRWQLSYRHHPEMEKS